MKFREFNLYAGFIVLEKNILRKGRKFKNIYGYN